MKTVFSGFPMPSADHCLALSSTPECEHDVQVNRTVRATDEQISTAVEHMQQVARLTAGIALQSALIDGKQTADGLISELLQLGSVTHSQMTSIDGKRLRNTLKSLKDLPNAMVDSKEVQEVEKRLEEMEELRKLVKVAGGGSTWEGKVGFIKEMDDIIEKGINLTQFSAANDLLSKWKHTFDEAMKKTLNKDNYKYVINNVKDSTQSILTLAKEWTQPTADLLKYPTIESAQKSLSPLSALIDIVQKALYMKGSVNPQATDKDFDTIKNNINLLSTLSASLGSILPDLQTVQNILEARESHVGQSLKYPGFANGFEDLKRALFEDFSDEWLQTMVDRDRMGAALKPIKTLIPAFTRVDKVFEHLSSSRVKHLLSPVSEVRTVSTDLTSTTSAFDEFWKCKESLSQLDNPSVNSVQQYLSSAKKLDAELNKLRATADTFVREWNNPVTIKMLNDVIGLCVVGDDAVLAKTIKTLRESQTMQTLNGVMDTGEKKFNSFSKYVDNIKEHADKLNKNSKDADDYVNSLSNYRPLFTCLHDFGPTNASLVTAGIGISRKFRAAKGDVQVVEEGEATVDGVLNAVAMFGSLEGVVAKMKGASSPESDALRALPNLEKHSEVIGSAARGVDAMKKSLDWRSKADIVIRNAGVVETYLASAPLNQEDKANLDAVVQLKASLPMMYQQLESWKGQDIGASSSLLGTYLSLFSAAQSVSGVSGDLRKMSTSVKKLIVLVPEPTARAQLEEVQMALAALASIGIDFASYSTSFTDSKDTLAALDTFFVNQRAKTTTVAPLLVAPPQMQSATAQTVESDTGLSWWNVIFGGTTALSSSAFVVTGILYCRLKKDSECALALENNRKIWNFKNEEEPLSPEGDPAAEATKNPGSAPAVSPAGNQAPAPGTSPAPPQSPAPGTSPAPPQSPAPGTSPAPPQSTTPGTTATSKSGRKLNGKPAGKPASKSNSKRSEKPAGKPASKSNSKRSEKPAGKPASKSDSKRSGKQSAPGSDPPNSEEETDVQHISKDKLREPDMFTHFFETEDNEKKYLQAILQAIDGKKKKATDEDIGKLDGHRFLDMLDRKWEAERSVEPEFAIHRMYVNTKEKLVYFPGSLLKLPSDTHLILAPSPKGDQSKQLEKVDEFWNTVAETHTGRIISLVRHDEWDNPEHCLKYFESTEDEVFTASKFTVMTKGDCVWHKGALRTFLKLHDTKNKKELMFAHHAMYKDWPKNGLPEEIDGLIDMVAYHYGTRYTTLIHSPDGRKRVGVLAYIILGVQLAIIEQRLPGPKDLQKIRKLCPGSMKTKEEFVFANVVICGSTHNWMNRNKTRAAVLLRIVDAYKEYRRRKAANENNAPNNGVGGGAGAAAAQPVPGGGNLVNGGALGAGAAAQPAADGNNLANAANNGVGGGAGAAAVPPAGAGVNLANDGALGAGAVAVQPVVNDNNGPMNGVQNNIANVENGQWVTPDANRDEAGKNRKCCTIL